jgi:alcohol dehydrogenase
MKGYMGFRGVPGHEFVGRVVESDRRELIGERVVGEINCPCRGCVLCRAGLGKHCRSRSVLGIQGRNGAFAEYLTLPDVNLHRVPASVSDREAVFVEPLAAACQALEQSGVSGGDKVVVLGDGKLGLLIAMIFAVSGAAVAVVGTHEKKLAIAERAGITARTVAGAASCAEADIVVEATGSPTGLECALRMVRPGGTIVLKTTVAAPHTLDLSRLVVDEVSLIGSRCGSFDEALALLAENRLDVLPLISAEYPLERGREAFAKAGERDSLKVLLTVSG